MKHAEYVTSIARSADACGFHFGAIIFRGRDIVSTGWCQCKTHPMQARYMKYAKTYKRANTFLHAEIHALVAARQDVAGYDIAIARIAGGELKPSYPCEACQAAIEVAGIRRIWYYNGKEWIYA